MLIKYFSKKIEFYKYKTIETANITLDTLFKGGLLLLFLITIVWASVFLYVAFYYTYVPSIEHVKNANLQFTSCDTGDKLSEKGVCSYLKSHVELTKEQQLFMLGQPYKITVFLEVPESEPNRALGMFMVCSQLMDKKLITVSMACKSTMLRYRSQLVHTLSTLILAPLYVFDVLEEKQMLEVELYSDFQDDQNNPVTDIVIELKSPKVQVYSARLQIDAHLTGLRYLMYHWPTISAALGITFNLIVILFIAVVSWWQLFASNQPAAEEQKEEKIFTLTSSEDEETKKYILDLKREPSSSEA